MSTKVMERTNILELVLLKQLPDCCRLLIAVFNYEAARTMKVVRGRSDNFPQIIQTIFAVDECCTGFSRDIPLGEMRIIDCNVGWIGDDKIKMFVVHCIKPISQSC